VTQEQEAICLAAALDALANHGWASGQAQYSDVAGYMADRNIDDPDQLMAEEAYRLVQLVQGDNSRVSVNFTE